MSAVVTIIHYDGEIVEKLGVSFDRYLKDIHMEIKRILVPSENARGVRRITHRFCISRRS